MRATNQFLGWQPASCAHVRNKCGRWRTLLRQRTLATTNGSSEGWERIESCKGGNATFGHEHAWSHCEEMVLLRHQCSLVHRCYKRNNTRVGRIISIWSILAHLTTFWRGTYIRSVEEAFWTNSVCEIKECSWQATEAAQGVSRPLIFEAVLKSCDQLRFIRGCLLLPERFFRKPFQVDLEENLRRGRERHPVFNLRGHEWRAAVFLWSCECSCSRLR